MTRLSVLDTAFLRMESARTPMHVGGLMTFKRPPNAPPDYLHRLTEALRAHPFMPAPFDQCLHWPAAHALPPQWVPTETDPEYHVRHSALPYPGGERELGVLVSRLHSHALDFDRPLWECHIIEGLENDRFALYLKAHHCAIDGMGAMKLVKSWLTADPTDPRSPGELRAALRTAREASAHRQDVAQARNLQEMLRGVLSRGKLQAGNARDLAATFYRLSRGGDNSAIRAALRTPDTPFNVPITGQRRLDPLCALGVRTGDQERRDGQPLEGPYRVGERRCRRHEFTRYATSTQVALANRRKDAGSAHELQKLPGLFSPGSVIDGFRALRELAGGERSDPVVPLVVGGLEKCANGMNVRHLCQVSCDSPPADPGNRTRFRESSRDASR